MENEKLNIVKELKNDIAKEGDEIRKSLLDKLFSLNTILSATFIVLYQLDKESSQIKILNILPFCTAVLILIYQYLELLVLGEAYNKVDKWEKGDYESLVNSRKSSFNVILLSIILTIIELIYLFAILLDFKIT